MNRKKTQILSRKKRSKEEEEEISRDFFQSEKSVFCNNGVVLGTKINVHGHTAQAVNERINKTRQQFDSVAYSVFEKLEIRPQTKIKLYRACFRTILLYGLEQYDLSECDIRRLQMFQDGCLRKILNPEGRKKFAEDIPEEERDQIDFWSTKRIQEAANISSVKYDLLRFRLKYIATWFDARYKNVATYFNKCEFEFEQDIDADGPPQAARGLAKKPEEPLLEGWETVKWKYGVAREIWEIAWEEGWDEQRVHKELREDRQLGWPRPDQIWPAVTTLFEESAFPKEEWLTDGTPAGLLKWKTLADMMPCIWYEWKEDTEWKRKTECVHCGQWFLTEAGLEQQYTIPQKKKKKELVECF